MKKFSTPSVCGIIFLLFIYRPSFAQEVTEIVTDYNGYWLSNAAALNPVKPENNHNLLAFSFNGTRYATGVNNALLTANGLTFASGDFRALGVSAINGTVNTNTKIGLGAMYDGVYNGASIPPPAAGLPQYLTDGIQGLNLGTGVANLPIGQLVFSVSNLQASSINDGIPDILVTQIADPSSTTDSYQFANAADVTVGSAVNISFSSISPVGNWTADFYEASQNPMTLGVGLRQTDRTLRLWAADFSAFGITTGNYSSITTFKINLAGNSDVAFVAYNYAAITLLPASLSFFAGTAQGKDVRLAWQTLSEKDASYFEVETSTDAIAFIPLGRVPAANSVSGHQYSFIHANGFGATRYYRLKTTDRNGAFSYSHIIKVHKDGNALALQLQPNPAKNSVTVTHFADADGVLQVWSMSGAKLWEKRTRKEEARSQIDLTRFSNGMYQAVFISDKNRRSSLFLKE